MKRLKYVGLAVGILVAVLVIIGFFLPRNWHARASTTIHAPPAVIFPFVNDFREWAAWASIGLEDPTFQVTYSSPSRGMGAWQKWTSKKTGNGQLWITFADPAQGISYDSAIETTVRNGSGSVRFQRDGENTIVTWEDTGKLPAIIGGYFKGSLEKSLNEHFEKSLARLRGLIITER